MAYLEPYERLVYELRDPDSGRTRYVGITGHHCYCVERSLTVRLERHIGHSCGWRVAVWIAQLKRHGKKPTIHLLETVSSREGHRPEKKWIRHMVERGEFLLNRCCDTAEAEARGRTMEPDFLS